MSLKGGSKLLALLGSLALTFTFLFGAPPLLAGEIEVTVVAPDLKHPGDVAVYLEGVGGGPYAPPKVNPVIESGHMGFVLFVLPVLVGTTVEFVNPEEMPHVLFTPVKEYKNLNTESVVKGSPRVFTFDKLGKVPVLSKTHMEMEAYVVVLDNPFFAVTDRSGKATIKDAPEGSYRITAWHPRVKGKSAMVQVPKEGSVQLNIELRK